MRLYCTPILYCKYDLRLLFSVGLLDIPTSFVYIYHIRRKFWNLKQTLKKANGGWYQQVNKYLQAFFKPKMVKS